MNTKINYLKALSLLIFMSLVIVSCKDDEEKLKAGWTDALISQSITECTNDDSVIDLNKEDCSCIINGVAKEVTLEQFLKYSDTTPTLDSATIAKIEAITENCIL